MEVPQIARAAAAPEFRQYLVDLLVEICKVDTSINPDTAALGRAESQVFDILQRHFDGYALAGAASRRLPIDPAIDRHPFFSQLYYTVTPQRPAGLDCATTYAGRTNLILSVDAPAPPARTSAGPTFDQAVDVHVDVVRPYIPPRVEGGRVYGRGACDDKGPATALMGALKLVSDYLRQTRRRLARNFTGIIVIEEEMGGNGSLSAALDRRLKERYNSLLVLECTQSRIHPGNRGCVWYRLEGNLPGAGANLFEAAAFIIEELELEGRALRAESRHPMFPHRPVQTCHGIIGDCGQHPSRINAHVRFEVALEGPGASPSGAEPVVRDVIESALAQYLGVYGDKSKVTDPGTGKPKVDHHYDLKTTPRGLEVDVYGSTGHMGSIFENDGAITKMMTFVRALIRSREMVARAAGSGVKVNLLCPHLPDPARLLIEGGQGFLPTHDMEQVMRRMRTAVAAGAARYFHVMGRPAPSAEAVKVTFNKLHNAAFSGPPDSPDMLNAIAAAKAAGIWRDEPVRGWDVSCDSRIFACEYPDMQVLTAGPGSLVYAHADQEQVEVDEMVKFSEFLAYFILRQTGTI